MIVYATKTCPYCEKAKSLLDRKKVGYTVIDISDNPTLALEMTQKSGGRRTVPQIFIDGKCIGGFDDLNRLNDSAQLDKILTGNAE